MHINNNIPTKSDWDNLDKCLDLKYAYSVFFGKSNDEVQELFYRCVIERADELKHMPAIPFRYYMIGFGQFVEAGTFQLLDEADIASSYIKLVFFMLKNKHEYIFPIMNDVKPIVDDICLNQSKYDADIDVYGNFLELKNNIEKLLIERVS